MPQPWIEPHNPLAPTLAADAEISVLRGLLASSVPMPAMRLRLARALLDCGLHLAAIEEAGACLDQDPTLVEAWLVRAEAHAAAGAPASAATDFAIAADLAGDRPLILVRLAACELALERPEAAEASLRRAIAMAPRCAPALANLGSVLVRRGALAEAEAPCRAALALDVSLVAAHQNLSAILAETDPAAARAHRDAAYRRQQVFVKAPAHAARTILILAAADAANVPLASLFDPARTTLVTWYVEYATKGQDRALPPYDLVFNAIGDPDLAPALPPPVRRVLKTRLVLNHPHRVARTARAKLPRLLGGIAGVMVPPVICHQGEKSRAAAVARLGYPVLVRPLGSHGGIGLAKADDAQALSRLPDSPGHVTKYVDYADADGFFRKYRMIFVDRTPFAYHLAIGPGWMVHHCTTGMEHDPARRAEEQRFLAAPEAVLGGHAMAALAEIGRRLDLDYGGIDFGLLPDGRILVFEANATMLVEHAQGLFRYRSHAVKQIQLAFKAMLDQRRPLGLPAGPEPRSARPGRYDIRHAAAAAVL